MKWAATLGLILLACVLLRLPNTMLDVWDDAEITMKSQDNPGYEEWTVNSDCVPGWFSRWHEACNARQVKVL